MLVFFKRNTFLTYHSFIVHISSILFLLSKIKARVPQGGISLFFLFIIYITDQPSTNSITQADYKIILISSSDLNIVSLDTQTHKHKLNT